MADISEDAVAAALRAVERQEELAAREQREGGKESASHAELEALREQIRQKDRLLEMLAQQGREATEQVRQAREWLMRQAADHENQRKRAERERADIQRHGVAKLLEDLLPVYDSLDRALLHAAQGEDPAALALVEGMRMVQQQLVEALEAHGATRILALGEPFDPALHQAVDVVQTEAHPPNTVVAQTACGFRLHDRIVRPALVAVSRPLAAPTDGAEKV